MVGSQADSLDFSAQYAPPQDHPTRGILSFFLFGRQAQSPQNSHHTYTRTGTMVSTSSVVAAPAATSKVTNSPPSQPNLHCRLVVWDCPFPAAPLPLMVGCWLSPPTIPCPLCCPCALVAWRPVIIIAPRRVIIVAIFVDCHHAFAAPVNDWFLFVVLPSLCPHCCPPPPVYLCVLNRVPT